MWIVTKADELYHIGMPRRSGRYPFGSGKRPFQGIEKAGKSKNNDPNRKKINTIRDVNNDVQNITRSSTRLTDRFSRTKSKNYVNKNMTDDELQKQINRLNLEQRYNQLMNQKYDTSRGREVVHNILDTAGDIAAIGASAATIYLAIRSAK